MPSAGEVLLGSRLHSPRGSCPLPVAEALGSNVPTTAADPSSSLPLWLLPNRPGLVQMSPPPRSCPDPIRSGTGPTAMTRDRGEVKTASGTADPLSDLGEVP